MRSMVEGPRQRRGNGAASDPLRLRAAPLHHPLRGRSPSPSKLGAE